jgi:hypothetical protein
MDVRVDETRDEPAAAEVDLLAWNTTRRAEIITDRDDPAAGDEHILASERLGCEELTLAK